MHVRNKIISRNSIYTSNKRPNSVGRITRILETVGLLVIVAIRGGKRPANEYAFVLYIEEER
jgi:hypothetical protein